MFKNLFVFTALLLVCKVYGQTRVEYVTQPCSSSVATTVQAPPQIVVPAYFKPVLSPYESCIQEPVPFVPSYSGFNGYNSYAPSYPQPMPPIIIEDDDDDNINHLLYFLIFAMRNKRNCGSGNCGGYNGGCNGGCGCGGGYNCGCGGGYNCGCGGFNGGYNNGCGCGGNCGGFCGGNCGFDNYNFGGFPNFGSCSGVNYIPYPIPYPMSGAYPYNFAGCGSCPDNSCNCIEETYQSQCNPEISVVFRTEGGCCTC